MMGRLKIIVPLTAALLVGGTVVWVLMKGRTPLQDDWAGVAADRAGAGAELSSMAPGGDPQVAPSKVARSEKEGPDMSPPDSPPSPREGRKGGNRYDPSGAADRAGERGSRTSEPLSPEAADLARKAAALGSQALADALRHAIENPEQGELLGLLIGNLTLKGTRFTPDDVPLLFDALKNSDDYGLQMLALTHLDRIDSPDAKVDGYVSYLREGRSPSLADDVIQRLGELNTPAAVDGLLDLIQDDNLRRHRPALAESLGRTKAPEAVRPLRALLDQAVEPRDQRAYLSALKGIGTEDAYGAVVDYARVEQNRSALSYVQEIQDPAAVPILADALNERSYPDFQRAILRSLRRQRDPGAIPSIQQFLDHTQDSRLAYEALYAYGDMGTPRHIPFLERMASRTTEKSLQRHIQFAIQRIQRRADAGTPQVRSVRRGS